MSRNVTHSVTIESEFPALTNAESDDSLRFLISAEGEVLYMTAALRSFLNWGDANDDAQPATPAAYPRQWFDLIVPENGESLSFVQTIEAGRHEMRLQRGDMVTTPRLQCRIDWVERPDGSRMLVGAVLDTGMAQPELMEESGTGEDLRPFLDMSRDYFLTLRRDGRFLRTNRAFREILGLDATTVGQYRLLNLIYPDDRLEMHAVISALFNSDDDNDDSDWFSATRTEETAITNQERRTLLNFSRGAEETEPEEVPDETTVSLEARIIGLNQSVRHVAWRLKVTDNVLFVLGQDVTAAKNHEAALKQRQAQLQEVEQIANLGHWSWQVGAEEIEWSDELFRIFGVSRLHFKPTIETLHAMVQRKDLGHVIHAFQSALIQKNDYDIDFRLRRADGQIRSVKCQGRCVLDEDGEVTALYGIIQDITQQVENERDLREAKEAAEQAYAAKSRFLANMSHELRTPLNAIIGFSEMMQRQLLGPLGSERYIDYITGIRESGEHLLDLINDILDMSKIEAGKYVLHPESMNLAKSLRMVIHMMEGRAQEGGIALRTEFPEDEDITILADRRALLQVLLNLVSNAIKFSHAGGSVTLGFAPRADHVELWVLDNGIGIPSDKVERVLRPFEQAANEYTRKHQGSGLGLSITKDLVEMHSGDLKITSTEGRGTRVSILLPYNGAQTGEAAGC